MTNSNGRALSRGVACPFCGKEMVLANGCPHVAFFYQILCNDFIYVRDDLLDHQVFQVQDGGPPPTPDSVTDMIPGIKLHHVTPGTPVTGVVWGFLPDTMKESK